MFFCLASRQSFTNMSQSSFPEADGLLISIGREAQRQFFVQVCLGA